MDYQSIIRDVPDFPKPGIVFKDLTTLWKNKEALKSSIDELAEHCRGKKVDKIVCAESRGFITGGALAYLLGAGFVPARKPSKLPAKTVCQSYDLEYGTASLELHEDSIEPGDKVLIFDDLLATGGTSCAMGELVERLGGEVVECLYLVELTFLEGRKKVKYPMFSLIKF